LKRKITKRNNGYLSIWTQLGAAFKKSLPFSNNKIADPRAAHAKNLGKISSSENISTYLLKGDQ